MNDSVENSWKTQDKLRTGGIVRVKQGVRCSTLWTSYYITRLTFIFFKLRCNNFDETTFRLCLSDKALILCMLIYWHNNTV